MKRVLTTVLAVALLLGLGALAVLALPSANAPLAAAPVVSAAAAPEAPDGMNYYNAIALPLHSQMQFSNGGLAFTADGLANLVGASVTQVLRWDADNQWYEFWDPAIEDGVDFPLETGHMYWLLVDEYSPTVVSFVGDVPTQSEISFNLVGSSASCLYNEISLPLDQATITDADELAAAIGDVVQVLHWDSMNQWYEFWDPAIEDGVNFPVSIGYPYTLCMSQGKTWPVLP